MRHSRFVYMATTHKPRRIRSDMSVGKLQRSGGIIMVQGEFKNPWAFGDDVDWAFASLNETFGDKNMTLVNDWPRTLREPQPDSNTACDDATCNWHSTTPLSVFHEGVRPATRHG
ncbi:hypothetical protein BJV77DRAFT_1150119 [Russula vinacea]|nr:hypothetical protein BJV77DRAFT_1150119 [Russula vinacea]